MHQSVKLTDAIWLLQLVISSSLIHALGDPSQAPTGILILLVLSSSGFAYTPSVPSIDLHYSGSGFALINFAAYCFETSYKFPQITFLFCCKLLLWLKVHFGKKTLWNGVCHLLWPRVVSPVSFLYKCAVIPFFLSVYRVSTTIMMPYWVRPIARMYTVSVWRTFYTSFLIWVYFYFEMQPFLLFQQGRQCAEGNLKNKCT